MFKVTTSLSITNLFADNHPLITITPASPAMLDSKQYVIYKHALDALAGHITVTEIAELGVAISPVIDVAPVVEQSAPKVEEAVEVEAPTALEEEAPIAEEVKEAVEEAVADVFSDIVKAPKNKNKSK